MIALFNRSSLACSKLITKTYSTSFSKGIQLFSPSIRPAIYAIYAFVRYADEIVDTFNDYNQEELFDQFVVDYKRALEAHISLNPIINSFQSVVREYHLHDFVTTFLTRMRMDLDVHEYTTREAYEHYIYGSADVVGLMCLRVFVNNNQERFDSLKEPASRLGSAFQKVNFLRDIKADTEDLGRSYFPNVNANVLTNENKMAIIADIEEDFKVAYKGVLRLPVESRLGVYLAYRYYLRLLKKLKHSDAKHILKGRIRITNTRKFVLLTKAYIRYKFNVI
ncbi:phytoene/squalene synthase family protein [Flavobacteriaceae bacterium F08102]|nr:phytoene/squalene synthase family protein [Flavobacteriaceae bacterium F08102]